MSQPSVAAFFTSRKRTASEDLRSGKAKVLVLDQEQQTLARSRTGSPVPIPRPLTPVSESNNAEEKMSPKMIVSSGKPRVTRARKLSSTQEGQTDIRESFLKRAGAGETGKSTVLFEKKGTLSPRKKGPATPKKNSGPTEGQRRAADSVTPKKASLGGSTRDLTLGEIKTRLTTSSRLAELKASIARIKNCEERLEKLKNGKNGNKEQSGKEKLQKEKEEKKLQIKKFEKIQLEIPVSPQKAARSPTKLLMSPTRNIAELPKTASPQRRLLFTPKETSVSPVKGSPTKVPAYQRYQSLVDAGTSALSLPFDYRFLAEAFRCVDTVCAMLFNRKEVITFKKLKPAVQELLRKNFTLEHLARIKTILPDAFNYRQEKLRNFGSTSKQDKYELVIIPIVNSKNGRNTPDADNILKSASESSMGPSVLLERRRKFYNVLLERVKLEHEKFLSSLDPPMVIPKEKITRWHPEFDVESCKPIEQAELPQPPNVDKGHSAKDVLEKAKTLFSCNTRMEKALQRLAEANMTSKSVSADPETKITANTETQTVESEPIRKVEISVVDTPPATPTTQTNFLNTAFKGIPKSLLEKVRAKQAAKALEAMTRTPDADKEIAIYSRLPDMVKTLRNIFVAEKKGVLMLEFVIKKLDNSFRTKLTPNELEEHIRLLCKLLPTWVSIHVVRKVDYLKLARDVDLAKVVKRLEIMANDKVKS